MVQKLGPGKHLLDIGSGNGHLLAAALKNDFACLGTDVSDRLAEAARRRSGAEVLVGDLASLELPSESFDVVNLDQVMSYVTDPLDFMHQVARLLRPGGICRIREYDPDSLNARVKGGRYWMYAPTRINLWPGKSISLLGARVGLPVYRIFAGTEASLTNWLATGVGAGFWSKARDTLRFVGRKSRLFSTGLAADTVYYLRKSG